MNLLIFVTLLAACVLLLWVTQSLALLAVGEPLAWPLRTTSTNRWVKLTRRAFVQVMWGTLLIGFPLAIGLDPRSYFSPMFPAPDWPGLARGYLLCVSVMALCYAVEIFFGWVRWQRQFCPQTCRNKMLRRLLLSCPLALMEEAVFRGLLLEQLARAMPFGIGGDAAAIVISSMLFSLSHFVRPDDQRPFWQPAAGLFLVGAVCGTTYVVGGHTLWIPVTIHAAGILVAETARIFTKKKGPKLLVGYQAYPHCGLLGATILVGLAVAMGV